MRLRERNYQFLHSFVDSLELLRRKEIVEFKGNENSKIEEKIAQKRSEMKFEDFEAIEEKEI